MRISYAVLFFILAASPGIALGDTGTDQDHCNAAYHAQDHQGVITWCRAAAEDYDIDAAHQAGETHFHSLLMEGLDLVDVSVSEGILGDTVDSYSVAKNARSIFQNVLSGASDQRFLDAATDGMNHANNLIELNQSSP
jgi:hypothetical protein